MAQEESRAKPRRRQAPLRLCGLAQEILWMKSMPRFVILEHDWPEKHWDFMLEAGPVLETWKLPAAPKPGVTIPAEKSFDHRLIYLDYEGPISGGRGSVIRWDAGTYLPILGDESNRRIQLQGIRLQGMVELKHHENGWTWRFDGNDGTVGDT